MVDFVVAHGALCVGFPSVGSHFAPVDVAGFGIEREAEGIAATHHVDLGAGVWGAGLEEVPGGDFVAVFGGANAQDLAAEVVGVAGGAHRVGVIALLSIIDGGLASAFERIGVVAGGEEEQSVRAEFEAAALVADGVPAIGDDVEDFLLRGEIEEAALEGEAGEAVEQLGRVAVVKVELLAGGEVGGEGETEASVFAGVWALLVGFPKGRDGEFSDDEGATGVGIDAEEAAFALEDIDATVGGDTDLHWVAEIFGDGVDAKVLGGQRAEEKKREKEIFHEVRVRGEGFRRSIRKTP